MELCKHKSCVLGVCLCDAYEVVSPEAWCVGGDSGVPILVLLLWCRCLPIVGLGTLLLGVVVKGELRCGLVSSSNRVYCCRYELELEVGICLGLTN